MDSRLPSFAHLWCFKLNIVILPQTNCMITSYILRITTSDLTSLEIQILGDFFKVSLPYPGRETEEITFNNDQDLLTLKIKLFGEIGSTVNILIIRVDDGRTWNETLRILKDNFFKRDYSLKINDFNEVFVDLPNSSNDKFVGDGERDFKGAAILPTAKEKNSLLQIFYATNRQKAAKLETVKFPDYNGVISNIKYGICNVNIPHARRLGELSRPNWWKFEFTEKPGKHFMILEGFELTESAFFSDISSRISVEDDMLVFIHGFNTTFEEAILKTAQISFDLGYKGVPISYSWPSKGSIFSYGDDEKSIIESCESIITFLKDLRENTDAKRINIIAHSMGNRGLMTALARLQDEEYFDNFVYNQVILAAPDIDAQVFVEELASKMKGCANRMTLYASSKDKALQVSRSKNASIIRLGESGDLITCSEALDTIDASNTDPTFLGHGYFASTAPLINDIFQLINSNSPPTERNLLSVETIFTKYWKFR